MKKQLKCLRCGCSKLYSVRREKVRCSYCRYEWKPSKLPLHLNHKEWSNILHWFLWGLPAVAIDQETGIHRQRILRALTNVRMAFQTDIPEIFSGTVEVDETYIGGQWKNKRLKERSKGAKRGRGTTKTPVFGILCRGEKYGHKWYLTWKRKR